jgi:hypothetical protein
LRYRFCADSFLYRKERKEPQRSQSKKAKKFYSRRKGAKPHKLCSFAPLREKKPLLKKTI